MKELEMRDLQEEWYRPMIQDDLSPIEIEIQRIAKRLESVCGSSYQTCDKCGEKGKGFSNLMEGTFTCLKCHFKKDMRCWSTIRSGSVRNEYGN